MPHTLGDVMIIDVMNNNDIFLSWRENGEKKIDIKSFRPYFYVEDSHKEIASYSVSKYLKRDFMALDQLCRFYIYILQLLFVGFFIV